MVYSGRCVVDRLSAMDDEGFHSVVFGTAFVSEPSSDFSFDAALAVSAFALEPIRKPKRPAASAKAANGFRIGS